MRVLALLVPLLLAGLAGCFEAEPPAIDEGDPPEEPSGPFLAYHAVAQDPEATRWSVFAVRPDGRADRIAYADDRSAEIRIGEGIGYSLEDARLLLTPAGGNLNRSTGGLVTQVERGAVGPDAFARLRRALAEDWPATGTGLDTARREDVVRFRAGGGVDVLRMPPVLPEHAPLLAAWRAAQEAFRVEDVQVAREPVQPPGGPCLRTTLDLDREAFTPGEVLNVTATVENCGAEPVTLGLDACGAPPAWSVTVAAQGVSRALPLEGVGAARIPSRACEGEPGTMFLAPHATAAQTRRWNGTLETCDAEGGCRLVEAPGPRVTILSHVTGQEHAAHAEVTLLPRDGNRTSLLLVKEHDWVNTTARGHLPADFGPHCAPVHYTLEPASVTFRAYGDEPFVPRPAVLVRDFRDGPPSNHTATVSADRLDAERMERNATLFSPFDAALPLAEVVVEGEDFLVNGTRIPPGGSHTLRATHDVVRQGDAYHVASILVFRNVGSAHVLSERGGACL